MRKTGTDAVGELDRQRLQDALAAERERLAVTLQSIGDAVIATDPEGRVVLLNRMAEEVTGWREAEASGRPAAEVFRVVSESTGEPVDDLVRKVIASGAVVGLANHSALVRRDGSKVSISDSAAPIRAASGALVGVVLVFRDVTRERQAEAALRESEERSRRQADELRAVLDAVPAAVFIARDRDARCIDANRTGMEMLRVPPGGNPSKTAPPEEAPTYRVLRDGREVPSEELPSQRAARGVEVRDWDCEIRFEDGTSRYLLGYAAPLHDDAGMASGSASAFVDITDRKRAEEALRRSHEALEQRVADRTAELIRAVDEVRAERQRFLDVLETLPVIVVLLRPDHRVVWVNQAYRAALGDNVGRLCYESQFGRDTPCPECQAFTPLRSGQPHHWEWTLPTGRTFEIHNYAFADAGGSPLVLEMDLDITERRQAERALRELNETLERRVAERTDELRRSEVALREADRNKSEFISVLSHELRNPLTPIRNSLYLLDRAPPGSDSALRAREVLQRQTDHLARLIDDLLDVTRISKGKIALKRSRLDVRDVVRRACDDHRTLFHDRNLELRVGVSGPAWIDADETRIVQVVGNLLQNSAKFTRDGGHVTVSVETGDGQVMVSVRDDGLGVEPDLLSRLFEPFVQGDGGLARTKGGLGLGLALVKGLVELHGGSVRAYSEGADRGTEMVVRLPLAPAPEPHAPAPISSGATRPLEILVIEDNPDAAQSIADVLEVEGHRVQIATDGRSGIAKARELEPELVLCDIGLPDVDGYEVARALRGDERLRSMRLIALSGYAQVEDRQRAADAGFDEHIPKPASPEALLAAVAGRGGA